MASVTVLLGTMLALLQAAHARPTLPAPLLSVRCREEIVTRLDRWEARHQWRLDTSSGDDTIYRSPTKQLGVWIELRLYRSGPVEAYRISADEVVEARWRGASCASTVNVALRKAGTKAAFTDRELRDVIARHPAGIVYAWSPHMPLSLKALFYARRAAKQLGIPIYEVLDPHADARFARSEAARTGIGPGALKPMESIELFFRGMPQHYPSLVVFSRGRIAGSTVPGLKLPDTYVRMISARLSAKEEP